MCRETNGHDAVHVTLIIKSIQLNMWIAEGSAFYLKYRKIAVFSDFGHYTPHGD